MLKLKRIDWGAVLSLVVFVAAITLALLMVIPAMVEKKLFVYDFSAPIDWWLVAVHADLGFLVFMAGFFLVQIWKEVVHARRCHCRVA
jgi:RsiW-degrading membrane proteinase PrsW (M82 family)